jgi:hypothetical protein
LIQGGETPARRLSFHLWVYDREHKVLLFIWLCERCGTRLGEAAKRLEYEPLPRHNDERLAPLH